MGPVSARSLPSKRPRPAIFAPNTRSRVASTPVRMMLRIAWIRTSSSAPSFRGATMRIDQTHRPWLVGTVLAFLAVTVVYAVYSFRTPGGPRGGTVIGLTFGIAGYALMLFEGLLDVRKKVPIWRVGRAQMW